MAYLSHNSLMRSRASALVLTMVLVVGMVALVSIASDNQFGSRKLATLSLDRQRARFAAESVAALVEAKLVELASTPNSQSNELDNLSRDFHELIDEWWGLRGACYTDSQGAYHEATNGLWMNGCMVRWRLEPVRVYAKTREATGRVSGNFTINTELDPLKAEQRRDLTNSSDLIAEDPGFFHFRIVTEASTLLDWKDGDERPWQQPETSLSTQIAEKSPRVSVQAQRVVQLQVINLFKYALFHAQEDERGDIDLQVGANFSILKGSVHSNAAIYIRGGENRGFVANPRNYHEMACGDSGHNSSTQALTLGSQIEPIDVVGVSGIFRMGKTANLLIGVDYPERRVVSPFQVPIRDNDTDRFNLNGDSSSSTRHRINGVPFTLLNDSRSPAALESAFKGRVRDQNNGGALVKTLANIPEMAGRPLEFQELAGVDERLYRVGGVVTRFAPTSSASPLYHGAIPPSLTESASGPTALPVSAGDLPLYWDANYVRKDVNAALDRHPRPAGVEADFPGLRLTVPADVTGYQFANDTIGDGFNDLEAKGYYLERGVFGRSMSAPEYYRSATVPRSLAMTGLVIRERPRQTILDASGMATTMPRPGRLAAGYSEAQFDLYRKTYATYLKSQYVVLFAGRNISENFFNTIMRAQSNTNYPEQNFIITEDEFVDSRESGWMAGVYGINPARYVGGNSYRINVLTLNVRAIQDYLRLTPANTIDPEFDSGFARAYFNGLIYVHRTRRSQTYHPINAPHYAWTAPAPDASNLPLSNRYVPPQVMVGSVAIPARNYDDLTDVREGDGPFETTRCAVRIRGGLNVDSATPANQDENDSMRKKFAMIDWESTGTNDPKGNSGLTIITPDRCYLWGDYNTTTRPDPHDATKELTVPCAIFADGVTALSANWQDGMWQDYRTWGRNPPKAYGDNERNHFAISTKYITSLVVNNVPNANWNVRSFGTGGSADTIRMLEKWSGRRFTFRGSMVVLNEQRYSRGGHSYTASVLNNFARVYETGTINFAFNADLLTRSGQPPFSPWGFRVTRVVSAINELDN